MAIKEKLGADVATEFCEMVMKMETLGAYEFISTFYNFADNNFKVDGIEFVRYLDPLADRKELEELGDTYYSNPNFVAKPEMLNYEDEVRKTGEIKYDFISSILKINK